MEEHQFNLLQRRTARKTAIRQCQ